MQCSLERELQIPPKEEILAPKEETKEEPKFWSSHKWRIIEEAKWRHPLKQKNPNKGEK